MRTSIFSRFFNRRGNDSLIFDIGMNNGNDTEYYLSKGFRVVAVEANPLLAAKGRERFQKEIFNKKLTILNQGIWNTNSNMVFYENLNNDHWSSFDKNYGTRDGTKYRTHCIHCSKVDFLFEAYGTPHYMKIDVEGADRHILNDMCGLKSRPRFISVEEYGVEALGALRALGYEKFIVAPQRDKSWCHGQSLGRAFNGEDSGLFGFELPFEWMTYDAMYKFFTETIRTDKNQYIGPPDEWYDFHATN